MSSPAISPGKNSNTSTMLRHGLSQDFKRHGLVLGSLLWLSLLPAGAADSGADVIVIYNSRLPESRQVAEYYAQRRQVPTNQVFGFELSTNEAITRGEYLDQLQRPLLRLLETNRLFAYRTDDQGVRRLVDARIRYAALCYGVPLKVYHDPNLIEPGTELVNKSIRNSSASVDSDLACLPITDPKFIWTGPRMNPFYTATNALRLHPTNGILLVARLDGPTPAIARSLVDKSLEAETNGLWGRAYFDAGASRHNDSFVPGDQWIRAAAELCRRLGFETELEDTAETFPATFPMSQTAFYAGWYAGNANGPFSWHGVEFMPGAFAYHLHSFSALSIRSTNQYWVGPLLASGATATMGCVDEPYLAMTPDLTVFFSRFIALGFSFGEAAWASQGVLSWQTTVVGDPLYRPFARRPEQRASELEKRQNKLVEWYSLMVMNMNLAHGSDVSEAIDALEKAPATKLSAVLSEKLGDLYWKKKQLSFALDEYEQALKLGPTPVQKLRLYQRLAERHHFYGNTQKAFDYNEKLLTEFPDYPDQLGVYQKLLPLAKKLEKKEEVERCEREIKRLTPPPPPIPPQTPAK